MAGSTEGNARLHRCAQRGFLAAVANQSGSELPRSAVSWRTGGAGVRFLPLTLLSGEPVISEGVRRAVGAVASSVSARSSETCLPNPW